MRTRKLARMLSPVASESEMRLSAWSVASIDRSSPCSRAAYTGLAGVLPVFRTARSSTIGFGT